MRKYAKTILLLICAACLSGRMQAVYGQPSSLHDSLRYLLKHFHENAKDKKLKLVMKEALAAFSTDAISDSLSKKLLAADSILMTDGSALNKQLILSYAETLVQALQYLSPVQLHPDYAASLNTLAFLYYNMGKYEKMLQVCEHEVAVEKKILGERDPDYANSLSMLATSYSRLGRYDKALPLYRQALNILQEVLGEEHPDCANILNNIGAAYHYLGQYDEALSFYLKAVAITKKELGEKDPDYATSLASLALSYNMKGEYDKALSLYQKANFILKAAMKEDDPWYGVNLDNLAVLYEQLGQDDKALSLYRQALEIKRKVMGEKHPAYATSLANMGLLYQKTRQYDKALSLFQESLVIRKNVFGQEHLTYAAGLSNLAGIYQDQGLYQKALPLYLQAWDIIKKQGEDHPGYGDGLYNLADLYSTMDEYEKALPLFQQALTVRKKVLGENHTLYASGLSRLSKLYIDMGKQEASVPLLIQASGITVRLLNQTYTALSEQEKIALLHSKKLQFEYLPSLLVTGGAEQPALVKQVYTDELVLKGMVLQNQQQVLNSIRKSGDSAALKMYEQWRFNKAFVGKQLLLPIAKRLPYLDSLLEATNQLEQQLSQSSAAFRNLKSSQAVTPEMIAAKLPGGQAAIEFVSFRLYDRRWTDSTFYAALVLLSGDSNARFVPLFEERQLQRLLHTLSKQVNTQAVIEKVYPGNNTSTYADSLYQMVWKPLEKYLAGIHTVTYAPAGLLHRIAFAALQADSTHLLIDKYQLKQVLTTSTLMEPLPIFQKPHTASVWGGIDYSLSNGAITEKGGHKKQNSTDTRISSFNLYAWDSRGQRAKEGWGALPYSKQEADSLVKILAGAGAAVATSRGAQATEEAFKSLDGKSPQVLHLSTHGFFLPVAEHRKDEFGRENSAFALQQNPMFRSGLVLAGGNDAWQGKPAIAAREDGILTAYEIAQLDLSNTDLMVLSACETALGDVRGNEGVIGLQRALKLAGVKQLIISLWNVPDKPTMQLMTMFYRNWLSGQPVREALRSAQLKMKQKYPPYFWAAFVVVE